MSEWEELNKKLMATRSNINPIIPVPLSVLSPCEWTKQFEPQTHKSVGTGSLQDHLPSPPGEPSVPSKLTGFDRSGREKVIRFYRYACHVGGIFILSTEQRGETDRTWIYNLHNDLHLNSVLALLSVLRDTRSSNSHTHTAYTKFIWIVTNIHRHTQTHMVKTYACTHNCVCCCLKDLRLPSMLTRTHTDALRNLQKWAEFTRVRVSVSKLYTCSRLSGTHTNTLTD